MIFPSNFEQKIGFDQIRRMLAEGCLSELGCEHAASMGFSNDPVIIRHQLQLTEEMRRVMLSSENFPSQDYYNLTGSLLSIRIAGTFLDTDQIAELKLSLSAIVQILSFFSSGEKDSYPNLNALSREISIDKNIIHEIDRIIDDKSQIRDDASADLKKIRKDKKARQVVVEKKINQELAVAKKSGWTPKDADLTIRDGRLVIPMINTYKRKIPGFVLDESATGQTVFVEPAEIMEVNNEIRELGHAERREIIKILTAFADLIRPDIDPMLEAYQFLGKIDFLRAKALFAIQTRSAHPVMISGTPGIFWTKAIHPLLFLSHSRQNKPVVPLTIQLDTDQRILIITGPNAGGKSVCLKTVGLIQYMFQCGLLPPVREDSSFGIFQKIFLDIGDEQSLENDLSTYTSKLLNIKYFIENIDPSSLFLIDEFGTGTDPSPGGSIAEASLEKINEKKAFGIVTTHYSNLKLLAGRFPGIVNGAMLYDSDHMKPLFQLKTGQPGSSFTFEIARSIGFPKDVLKNASKKMGRSQLDFDKELQNLEVEKTEVVRKSTELQVADTFLAELIEKYTKLKNELETSKAEILKKAREEALQIVNQSNKVIEKVIKEIRENQAEKTKTRAAREEISSLKDELKQDFPVEKKLKPLNIKNIQQDPMGSPTRKKQTIYGDLQHKLTQFQMTLDIRGTRADEAISRLQRYLDDAILLGINELRVLHGKGNGILRQLTREYLSKQKEVREYKDEVLERGGSGVTLVSLKQ